MHGAAVGEPHPDRADLARVGPGDADPHTGVLVEAADVAEPELGEAGHDHPLDRADVLGSAHRVGDVDDRIPDELPRAVVRDVATAFHGHQLGTHRRRLDEHVDR